MNESWDTTYRNSLRHPSGIVQDGLSAEEIERLRRILRARQREIIVRSAVRFLVPVIVCCAFAWDAATYGPTVSALLLLVTLILYLAWAYVTKPLFDADILEFKNDRDALRRAYGSCDARGRTP